MKEILFLIISGIAVIDLGIVAIILGVHLALYK